MGIPGEAGLGSKTRSTPVGPGVGGLTGPQLPHLYNGNNHHTSFSCC